MKCPICGQTCSVITSPAGQQLRCYLCGYQSPGYSAPVPAQQTGPNCPCCGNPCSEEVTPAGRRLRCAVCGYQSPGYTR